MDTAQTGGKKPKSSDSTYKMAHSPSVRGNMKENKVCYLTKCELHGLAKLIQWIEEHPTAKKGYPKDILDPETLLNDAKVC